jgi:hypothetical protein
MIDDKRLTIGSFIRGSRNAGLGALVRGGFGIIGSAALLSSMAIAQVPTTTALPYLLQSPGTSVVVVTPSGPVVHVPPAVTLSGFGSLFGGGFNTLLSAPIAANATAAAIAQVRSAEYISKGNAAKQKIDQMNQDAKNAEQNIRDQNIDAFTCEDEFTAVKFNHHLKPADSSVCTLPEEQQAQEAEQELEALNEAGDTSQEAIEAAESAAEAAETAAEAAETAAEAALDAVDILESILETVSLFP